MAKVYVGTYAKYNAGSIGGAWLDLEDYSSREEFEAAARELHKDEADPELMFQDWEDIPEGMAGESWIKPELWDWLELDEDDREILAAWAELGASSEPTIEEARDAYQGTYDSEREFAEQLAEDLGLIQSDAQWPYTCIDWEHAARELMYDYSSVRRDGGLFIFHN